MAFSCFAFQCFDFLFRFRKIQRYRHRTHIMSKNPELRSFQQLPVQSGGATLDYMYIIVAMLLISSAEVILSMASLNNLVVDYAMGNVAMAEQMMGNAWWSTLCG